MGKNKKAIVTLALGEKYEQLWDKYCKKNWEPFAEKHGYDIIVIRRLLDQTSRVNERSPHWQKLLILEAEETQGYDYLVWVDSDIVINFMSAPCIVEANQSDKIGVVRYSESYSAEIFDGGFVRSVNQNTSQSVKEAGLMTFSQKYVNAGLPGDVQDMINTGVMVLQPHHRDVLRTVYDEYSENPYSAKENVPLAYHLLKNDLVNGIDQRFNKIFDLEVAHNHPYLAQNGTTLDTKYLYLIVNSVYVNSFFLHFIEGLTRGYMRLVIPGSTYPEYVAFVEQKIPSQPFVVGTHKILL